MTDPIEITPLDGPNQALLENVRPGAWKNPEPAPRYNLVVIGAGTAGLVSAAGAAGLGAKVALVEKNLFGGDCLNTGCVPSKSILRSARAVYDLKDAARFGAEASGAHIDFEKIMERMRRIRASISANDSAHRFKSLGVDVFIGEAKFRDAHSLTVGNAVLHFRKAVIASGARAGLPDIPGLREAGCLTNETVFNLTRLPRRLGVIGGGPIGCELAQAFRRFGADVALFERGRQLLGKEDPEASLILQRRFEAEGIRLHLESRIVRVERQDSGKTIVFETAGKEEKWEADQILAGAGRLPNIEGMGLEAAGVKADARGISVNDFLQTSNPDIYAAGDICLPHKFTHTADASARIAIQNALFFGKKRWSGLIVPWCTYTDPEIAHTGMYAAEAAAGGRPAAELTIPLKDIDRAITDGEEAGFVKVLYEKRNGRILGATIVARHAGEMITEITAAIHARLGLGTLASVIHPYPTQAEGVKRTADAYNRTRLAPWIKGVLTKFFAFRR